MKHNYELWWLWVLRSAATAMFAMIAVTFPPLTSVLAIYLYGGYVKLDGFLLLGLNAESSTAGPYLVVAGVASLMSGLAILMWPASAPASLLYTLAVLTVVRGVLEAVQAIRQRTHLWERGLRVIAAGLIVSFGIVLAAHDPLSRGVLVGAFALHACLISACQFVIGLEQWSRHLAKRAPHSTRNTHGRAPVGRQAI